MLEKIIRQYYDAIFRYCYHHMGSRAAAEDLCQDTFASFIEHYAEIRSMGKAKNYLYTIAKNKCRDYYKKKAPILMEEVPEQEKEECMEELVIVRQMIMNLPEAFREAVVLRYLFYALQVLCLEFGSLSAFTISWQDLNRLCSKCMF